MSRRALTEDPMTSHQNLTDTQLVLLSAASQRDDGFLVQPSRLKGSAAHKVIERLLAERLVEELTVGHEDPHWREAQDGTRFGFKITAAGLQAIEAEDG